MQQEPFGGARVRRKSSLQPKELEQELEMDKDRVKGAVDDAVGRAKRQVGEWTGDTRTQAEGAAQQIKGKTEKVVGQVKDAVRDARTDADRERAKTVEDRNREAEHAGSGAGKDRR